MQIATVSRKRVLVLGGSGLLGRHCFYGLKDDFNLTSTYNASLSPHEGYTFFNALDGEAAVQKLLEKYQPDVIINTIALVSVDGCEQNPYLAKRLNLDLVTNIVNSLERLGLKDTYLIQISTDSVYGESVGQKNIPWLEGDNLNPLSVYAKTKALGEVEARRHVGPVLILRTAFYGFSRHSSKGLLWWIINNIKNCRVMDGWENIYFSPVSAVTLVNLIKVMLDQKMVGTYNVGSVDSCNKFDFVDAVAEEIGQPYKINRVSYSKSGVLSLRPSYSVLNSTKLSNDLLWCTCWRDDLRCYLRSRLNSLMGDK